MILVTFAWFLLRFSLRMMKTKGDTPLYPRSKGVLPLWTPQNGVGVISDTQVVLTLKGAALSRLEI